MSETENSLQSQIDDGVKIKVLQSSIACAKFKLEAEYKCCWTCLNFNIDGMCDIYKKPVPESFSYSHGKCQKWDGDDIPF